MAVALGEQLLLASRAGFRHDVLERFHLFSGEAAPVLDHPHARDRGLDGQRTEDPGEERNDERGAKPEKKGRRMDLHGDPLICCGGYQPGYRVFATFVLRPCVTRVAERKNSIPRAERAFDGPGVKLPQCHYLTRC